MKNLAAVMTGISTMAVQERPAPKASPGKAVVKIQSVGVCGSDVGYFHKGKIGNYVVEGDIILGHEASGEVVEVGSDVTNVQPGDRVAIEPGSPCRDCSECMRGKYHLCSDFKFLATPPFDGALVQYLSVDSRQLFIIPDSMSFNEGALVEPLSVGLWAAQRAKLRPGDDVLISGAGPIGLLAGEVARALGASSITLTDLSDFRLEIAREHGFRVENSNSRGQLPGGFDVLLECSGAPGVLAEALKRLGNNGRAAVVGLEKSDATPLPLSLLNKKELDIYLVNRYQFTWPLGISLISDGRVNLDGIITHEFPLSQSADALNLSSVASDSLKTVIYPQMI